MNNEMPIPHPPPTKEELVEWEKLTANEITIIDDAILSVVCAHWLKVAALVTRIKKALEKDYPFFSECFYAARIEWLAEKGKIDSQGDLTCMRFSEVRLLPNIGRNDS